MGQNTIDFVSKMGQKSIVYVPKMGQIRLILSYIVNRLIVNELNRKLFFYFTSNAASINAFKFR